MAAWGLPGACRNKCDLQKRVFSWGTRNGKESGLREVRVKVNGHDYEREVEPRVLLVHFLREDLNLTGTMVGCNTSNCGACTVLMDWESVKSCTVFAVQADGRLFTNVQATTENGNWHPMQQAFHESHALQCGYCTPGMIMASINIVKAVRLAAQHVERPVEAS